MLPEDFKFHIYNDTGVTIEFSTDGPNNTFTIKSRGWKYGTDGAVTYDTSENTWFADPTADLATATGLEAASAVDNGTDLWVGAHCIASLVTDAATDGNLEIYMEASTDGGTTYPSDAADFDTQEDLQLVAVIALGTTTEDRSVNFEI